MACLAVSPLPAQSADDRPDSAWREMSAGTDVTANVWLLYAGATLAPLGVVGRDGLLLRSGGGYGQYRYSGPRFGDPAGSERKFLGTVSYIDALVGYQKKVGPLTAKAFVGIAAIDHVIAPGDPIALGGLLAQGLEYGVKGVTELWLDIGSAAWASLDMSWTSAHQTYSSRARLGYRLLPQLSAGLEAGVNGNALDGEPLPDGKPRQELKPAGRIGLFARYEWAATEVSLSAGVTRNAWDVDGDLELREGYATLNLLMRY